LLDELERVGKWLHSVAQSKEFFDCFMIEFIVMTFRDLADSRAMWHGKNLDEKQRKEILKACFNES